MSAVRELFPFYHPPKSVVLTQLDTHAQNSNLDFAKIIFLDFDGVLHPEDYRPETEFCFVENMADAMRMVDLDHRVPIVISST